MKNLCIVLSLISILFCVSCSESGSDSSITPPKESVFPIITTENLLDIYTDEIRGTSKLTRNASSISIEIETTNLIPGHVYQIMCAVFNKPENCEGRCDATDFQSNNADATGVEAISFVMAGKMVNSTSATFTGTLNINDITTYDWIPVTAPENGWGGLRDPETAQINLLVRSQGPFQSDNSSNQRNTYANACSFNNWNILDPQSRVPEEIGECAFIQTSDHVAPN